MKRTKRSIRGKVFTDIAISDLSNKSTCINLSIPIDIACHHCKPKLCILTHRRVSKKTKSERQKCKRSQCQQLWDTYWTNLPHVTSGILHSQNLQRRYLGIRPDIVINNHYKNVQCAETNEINLQMNLDKNVTDKHITTQSRAPVEEVVEEEANVQNMPDMDTYLKQRYPRKYEKSRKEWYHPRDENILPHQLDRLMNPLLLLLKTLSCSSIKTAVILLKRVLNKNDAMLNEFETESGFIIVIIWD